MTNESLGDRIRARRDARLAATHARSATTTDRDVIKKELQDYVDTQIAALAAKNGLTLP